MPTLADDFIPVTGGADLPKARFRDDMDHLRDLVVDSDLDRHIVQMLALHPKLRVRFRNRDLASLDMATKQALIADMNEVLGIRPLRRARK